MKVGEVGLVPRAGAEFMALETTAEAGTCLACRSMLGLVGSSAQAEGGGEGGESGAPPTLDNPCVLPCQAQTVTLSLLKDSRVHCPG